MTKGFILLLPIPNVWKLQMSTRQKVTVVGIFFLGAFTTITGIIRLHFVTEAYASLDEQVFFNDIYCQSYPQFPSGSLLCLQDHPFTRFLMQPFLPRAYFAKSTYTCPIDNYAPAFYWSVIECNVGILSACLPSLKPLLSAYAISSPTLQRLVRSWMSSFRSTSSNRSKTGDTPVSSVNKRNKTSKPWGRDRLNSVSEHELTESHHNVLGAPQNRAFAAAYERNHESKESDLIHCYDTYTISDKTYSKRPKEDV